MLLSCGSAREAVFPALLLSWPRQRYPHRTDADALVSCGALCRPSLNYETRRRSLPSSAAVQLRYGTRHFQAPCA